MRQTKKRFRSIFLLGLFIFLAPFSIFASDVEMADVMRSNGKIYVVIGVLSIIFLGILIFLLLIERRLKALERATDTE